MSEIYKRQYRAYLEQLYKTCTKCKKSLQLFVSAQFIPANKDDYALRPFCKECADEIWQKHQQE
jgi:hypothetical protein